MATLTIANIDDSLVGALQARANRNHRSVEQEALLILRHAVDQRRRTADERVRLAREISAMSPRAQTTDSVTLLREERDL